MVLDMQPHDRAEYRAQMGHECLGFEPGRLTAWVQEAGLEEARVQPLPPSVGVKGPPLFVALCKKPVPAGKLSPARSSGKGYNVSPTQKKGSAR